MELNTYIGELVEKHVATGFVDCNLIERLKTIFANRDQIGRKELLLFAYLIGANAEESNALLKMLGHPILYVKKREDAIWRFVLNHHLDITSIVDEIFPQNVDEIQDES